MDAARAVFVDLKPGDPAPDFRQRSPANAAFNFNTLGGLWIVLCFHISAGDARGAQAVAAMHARGDLFDGLRAAAFAVSLNPGDEARLDVARPSLSAFWDGDGRVARLYGAAPQDDAPTQARDRIPARRMWVVVDPSQRIHAVVPFRPDGSEAAEVFALVERAPAAGALAGFEVSAPVMALPQVFEPELCRRLIAVYRAQGGEMSGFMREVDGRTVGVTDPAHKVRRDVLLADEQLKTAVRERISRRIGPEIRKVCQFEVTRLERYLVACYAADDGGHFRAHRDNTTSGTAHRRFAVSINLNDGFEGGAISFPEYGPRAYTPPPGGAIVFSCSLLHQVSRVTAGERYAFLPFLYDEAAAKVREANLSKVAT